MNDTNAGRCLQRCRSNFADVFNCIGSKERSYWWFYRFFAEAIAALSAPVICLTDFFWIFSHIKGKKWREPLSSAITYFDSSLSISSRFFPNKMGEGDAEVKARLVRSRRDFSVGSRLKLEQYSIRVIERALIELKLSWTIDGSMAQVGTEVLVKLAGPTFRSARAIDNSWVRIERL